MKSFSFIACAFVLSIVGCDGMKPKPNLSFRINGMTAPSIFVDHEFHLNAYHQHPGSVHSGVVEVTAEGYGLIGADAIGQVRQSWSFDSWAPNVSEAHLFKFKVSTIGDDLSLKFTFHVRSAETQAFYGQWSWAHSKWK